MRKLKEIVRFGTDFRAKQRTNFNLGEGDSKRSMKQMRSKTQNR